MGLERCFEVCAMVGNFSTMIGEYESGLIVTQGAHVTIYRNPLKLAGVVTKLTFSTLARRVEYRTCARRHSIAGRIQACQAARIDKVLCGLHRERWASGRKARTQRNGYVRRESDCKLSNAGHFK